MTNKEIGLDEAILKQMVEKDSVKVKLFKMGEEVMEMCEALKTDNLEHSCIEISQAIFVLRQLIAYDKELDMHWLMIEKLDKYNLSGKFWWFFQEDQYWKARIKEQIKIEYDKYRVKKGL